MDWVLSAVSASPVTRYRDELWLYIGNLGNCISFQWLLTGDFNQVLFDSDKWGGAPKGTHTNLFWELIQNCDLINLNFFGPKFTWSNSRQGEAQIMERLDRCLCIRSWNLKVQVATVDHLPKTHSDHHPLLIRLGWIKNELVVGRPFRFLAAWMEHDKFKISSAVYGGTLFPTRAD